MTKETLAREIRMETEAAGHGAIAIRGVGKSYRTGKTEFQALGNIRLDIAANEFVTIVGPSGCGKSTLLRIVAGLEEASVGEVTVDGVAVVGPGADRGMVFQGYTLFPWLTVRQNIEYGPKLKGVPILERRAVSNRYLRITRLESFANRFPKQLSGGMKQRVAIARALANGPKVLLMDEPFGALDAQTKLEMQEALLDVWAKEKTTVLFITHDIDEAIFLSQRILVMAAGPGRMIGEYQVALPAERTPEVREHPDFLKLKRELASLLKHKEA
ncbi:ABC transporter ATP-binding protein [Cohnella nanjingensis]|uniref:ABC transporter ATP-binding protein n=1 Tax=Cohnella nanjingensis TaxID=1387779 RepID=A0A7X0RXD6_9BACL|nr:ABC transporter ATP-binding protein [Cohnella nanjingensis]MBB6675417.1 ABC transporter ATP-binding protein [Cohnella nanjingensis]